MQPAPVFGKRSAPARTVSRGVSAPLTNLAKPDHAKPDHATFFAAARAELETDARPRVVPRSFRAALLAGFVTGCCLAGLDATQAGATLRALTGGMLAADAAPRFVPLVIALGLFGGARAAATSLLVAHWVLRRVGLTSHVAYAFGGGAVALAFSALVAALVQAGVLDAVQLASHGLVIDTAAGVGAGFLYRVLAGARHADH